MKKQTLRMAFILGILMLSSTLIKSEKAEAQQLEFNFKGVMSTQSIILAECMKVTCTNTKGNSCSSPGSIVIFDCKVEEIGNQ